MIGSLHRVVKSWWVRWQVARASVLRLILGSGGIVTAGWIATDQDVLDVAREADWSRLLRGRQVDALLAEHVLEHLDPDAAARAVGCAWRWLRPGGRFRVAVPDGYHPDPAYIEAVRPGGTGAGALDHRVLYNHGTLSALFSDAGFRVVPLEWHDQSGCFHCADWTPADGMVRRSLRFDSRNRDGSPIYTSLIIDAFKL